MFEWTLPVSKKQNAATNCSSLESDLKARLSTGSNSIFFQTIRNTDLKHIPIELNICIAIY
ncbi:hypothetical protein LEP1GSC193_3052 [Leptospira alstonii serovar Pingchang str. 80-412]|uniref:Uncharacterized protein n=2 Tax=Leptospira alstonii TaxID=28452 RepID=M6CZK9_9LEPT|nr:hypothetical protein LEP1GSC194_4088 [Leptospira alstonii serovar Sichuan str. 79601]EQA79617.1 hypothetical protein LEP1GSC193_3052 [Leptospira alstonii serovar Pingchang str. 80-412]